MNHLTERDRKLLNALAEGKTNAEIAAEFYLAKQSVKNYLSRLYGRLGVGSRNEAVVWAIRNGVIETNGSCAGVSHERLETIDSPFVRVPDPDNQLASHEILAPLSKDLESKGTSEITSKGFRQPSIGKLALWASALLVATCIGALSYASAQSIIYGQSSFTFPVSSGKVDAVAAYLRVKYGNDVEHWIEEIEIGYPDGTTRMEPQAFFTFPTALDNRVSNELSEIVTEREHVGPWGNSGQ